MPSLPDSAAVFESFSDSQFEALTIFTDPDDVPDDVIMYGTLDMQYLVLTHLGVKKACWVSYTHVVTDDNEEYDCPFETILDAFDLHYTLNTSVEPVDEYWGGTYIDELEPGTTCVSRDYFISHDLDAIDWFEETTQQEGFSLRSPSFSKRMGLELGYPESAVEDYIDPDVEFSALRLKKHLFENLDAFDLAEIRYLNLVPFIPASTEECVNQAVSFGKQYRTALEALADEYEELEPLAHHQRDRLGSPEGYYEALKRAVEK